MKHIRIGLLLASLALAAVASVAHADRVSNYKVLSAATTTAKSAPIQSPCSYRTYQAAGATSGGAGAATVKIQGSNTEFPASDGDYVDLGTITLTLATTRSGDGFASQAPWRHMRAWVTSISGTGAAVDVYVGCGD